MSGVVGPELGQITWRLGEQIRKMLKLFRGYSALACAKSWLNAWAIARRMRDIRPLPCPFGCVDDGGSPIADDIRHCLKCEMLWKCAASAFGGEPGGSDVDRLAFGPIVDATERLAAVTRLASAFGIYHAVKIPWADALPPDAGRGAPRATTSAAALCAHAKE